MITDETVLTAVWEELIHIELLPDDVVILTAHDEQRLEEDKLEFADLKRLQLFILELTDGRPIRLITDTRNAYVKIDTEVLKQVANDDHINKTKVAEALVLNSLPNRIWVNFYLRIARPKVPARAFSQIDRAILWVREQHK